MVMLLDRARAPRREWVGPIAGVMIEPPRISISAGANIGRQRLTAASHRQPGGLNNMAQETVRLAEYAAALRYQDLPAEIVRRAKECIADTVAAIICGSALPWSRIVIRYAERT